MTSNLVPYCLIWHVLPMSALCLYVMLVTSCYMPNIGDLCKMRPSGTQINAIFIYSGT